MAQTGTPVAVQVFTDITVVPGLNSAKFYLANFDHIDFMWPKVEEMLEEKGEALLEVVTPSQIYSYLRKGMHQLWYVVDNDDIPLIMFTYIELLGTRKNLHIKFITGEKVQKYLPLMTKTLLDWARVENLSNVFITGRSGWGRLLKKYGLQEVAVVYEMDLTSMWRN